jgi:hypothetical protein
MTAEEIKDQIFIFNEPPTLEIWFTNGTGWEGDDVKIREVSHNFTTTNGLYITEKEGHLQEQQSVR